MSARKRLIRKGIVTCIFLAILAAVLAPVVFVHLAESVKLDSDRSLTAPIGEDAGDGEP